MFKQLYLEFLAKILFQVDEHELRLPPRVAHSPLELLLMIQLLYFFKNFVTLEFFIFYYLGLLILINFLYGQ